MNRRRELAAAALLGDQIPIEELAAIHAGAPLALAFINGRPGFVHLNGEPAALTSELIRLARFADLVRRAAAEQPSLSVLAVINAVDSELKRGTL